MFEVKRVERVDDVAPDLMAILNAPKAHVNLSKNIIPTRGYIFKKGLYNITEAKIIAGYFLDIMNSLIHPTQEVYVAGFAYLDNTRKTTVFYPYKFSSNGSHLTKTEPLMAIEGVRQNGSFKEEKDFQYVLEEEAKYRRSLYQKLGSDEAFKTFINNPPEIPGLKYVD